MRHHHHTSDAYRIHNITNATQACVDLQNKVWEQLGGDDVDPYALDWCVRPWWSNEQNCLPVRSGLIPPAPHLYNRPVCLADLDKPHGGTTDTDDDDADDTDMQNARRAKAAGRNLRYRLAQRSMKGLVSSEVFARPSWGQAGAGGSGSAAALPFEPCEEDYATAYLNRAVRFFGVFSCDCASAYLWLWMMGAA